jgi:three-Cys-motif partner protein
MNLHDKPFDETTLTKLQLFEDYAQAWLPTFLMQTHLTEIHIFDFFAGTGYDLEGKAGSPIRIIEKIIEQRGLIFRKQTDIVFHINEFDKSKFELLIESCNKRLAEESGIERFVKLKFYNEDFGILFPKLFSLIEKFPSLVYLDQNGVKFLSTEYFGKLEKTKQTDFLYFAASSYITRFGELKEFQPYLSFLDLNELKNSGHKKVHRNLTNQLKRKVSKDSKLKLYPFTLKKNTNIYGVIFGATHFRAVDKFLNLTWKYNGLNGDANFDIDEEFKKDQLDLFEGRKLTKIDIFKQSVRDKVLGGEIKTNLELLIFVYENGHIGKHADEVLKALKKEGKIKYDSNSPCVTYDSAFKNNIKVFYEKV